METQYLLEMKHIKKTFPGVNALQNVNFNLKSGEVHALLGENGAGKSTLIKVLGGIYIPDEGDIFIDGKEVSIRSVQDSRSKGISIIHQELVLVPEMTVAENIFLGREKIHNCFVNKKMMNTEAQKVLDFFDLKFSPAVNISSLTIAQQQMVEIAKAISFNAKIVVMDEPTSSLSDKEVDSLFQNIQKLKMKGVGIIYISHRMAELNQISDRVTVLRDGEYIGTVTTKETDNDALITMMVGRKLNSYYNRINSSEKEVVFEIKDLCGGTLVKDINFRLYKGEILGFSGLVGAGRTEVMKCIFGIDKYTKGEIYIENKAVKISTPADAIANGIALVPESRKKEALFLQQDVKFNISIKVIKDFIKGIFVNSKKEDSIAQKYINDMSIKTPSSAQLMLNLSGGNQQKVVIGRWLATNPKILILDEPTRGIDIAAKAEIYSIMNKLTMQGVSIIMISSELPEILNMSDRVVVMCNGSITATLPRSEVSQEQIMHYATFQN